MHPKIYTWIPKKAGRFLLPLLGTVLLGVAIWFFWPDDKQSTALKDFITDDAALIIQSKSINQAYSLFETDSSNLAASLPGLGELSGKLEFFRKVAGTKYKQMLENPFIAFWRQLPGGKWSGTLVLYSGIGEKSAVEELVTSLSLKEEMIKSSHTLYSSALSQKNDAGKAYFAALKDIFVISDSQESLLASINQSRRDDAPQKEIKDLMKSANKSAAFNAYFRPALIKTTLASLMREEFPGQAAFLSADPGWIIMDFMNDASGLIINGRKPISGGWDQFIGEEPCNNTILTNLAGDENLWTAIFTYPDFTDFYKAYCSFPQHNTPFDVNAEMEKIKETDASFDAGRDLFPAIGHSTMFVFDASQKTQASPAVVFEITDSSMINSFFNNARLFEKMKGRLYKAKLPYFSYVVWGPLFAFADSSYWSLGNSHLVVASDAGLCRKLRDLTNDKKDIAENNFSTLISWPLNFTDRIFAGDRLSGIKKSELAHKLKKLDLTLKRSGSTIFFNILIPLKGSKHLTRTEEITCAAPLSAEPLMIPDAQAELLIIYVMENHQLVIRGIKGKPYSENTLDAAITGKPVYFRKGETPYVLVATESKLYCFASNGEPKKGFPVEIAEGIRSFLFPVDYDHDGNVRLFFSDNSGRVRNFDSNGREVKGWKNIKPGKPADQVIHCKAGKKDYLLLIDREGEITIVNRKGEKTGETDKVASDIAPLIIGAKSSELFYFVAQDGSLCELKPNGKINVLKKNWISDFRLAAASGNCFYLLERNRLNEYNGKGDRLNSVSLPVSDARLETISVWNHSYMLAGNEGNKILFALPGLKSVGTLNAEFSGITVKGNTIYISGYSDNQIRVNMIEPE